LATAALRIGLSSLVTGSQAMDSMTGQQRWEQGRRRWTPWRGNNAGNGVSGSGIHGGGARLHGEAAALGTEATGRGSWTPGHWIRSRDVFAKQDEFEGAAGGSS
jgi:hypothetical protein